jgi:molybdopterin molybdotransferase
MTMALTVPPAPLTANPPKAARTLVPLSQALRALLHDLAPVAPVEIAPQDAVGCVLAEPLIVPGDLPAAATALRAGYALAAADTFGASAYGPMPLARAPEWVEAGGTLPAGSDALAEPDALMLRRGRAELSESLAPGQGVRRAGEDAPAGSCLRREGERLRALDLALARAAGLTQIQVRRPRLLLVETTTEGVAGACADLVARMAAGSGAAVIRVQAEMIADEEADFIVMVGEPNRLRQALPPDAVCIADQLALHPGQEGCVLRIGDVPVVFVPPLLDAAFALWLTLIGPALRHLASAVPDAAWPVAPLTGKIVSTIGFTEITLLRRRDGGLEPLATGDLPLSAMAEADGWLAIEPGQEGYAAGHPVAAWPL